MPTLHRLGRTDPTKVLAVRLIQAARTRSRGNAARSTLRYVHRLAPRPVQDLMSTTGAVRDDQGIGLCRAHARQEARLRHPHRHLEVLGLVAECPSHAAAARDDGLDLETGDQAQRLLHRWHGAKGLLMAVPMQQCTLARLRFERQLETTRGKLARQELLEQQRLARNRFHRLARKQASATRL